MVAAGLVALALIAQAEAGAAEPSAPPAASAPAAPAESAPTPPPAVRVTPPRRNPQPRRHCRRPRRRGATATRGASSWASAWLLVGDRASLRRGLGALLRGRRRRARDRGDLRRGRQRGQPLRPAAGLAALGSRFASARSRLRLTARGGRVLLGDHADGWGLGGAAGMLFLFSPTVGLELGYEFAAAPPRELLRRSRRAAHPRPDHRRPLRILSPLDGGRRSRHMSMSHVGGINSVGRVSASQAECRRFEPDIPLQKS